MASDVTYDRTYDGANIQECGKHILENVARGVLSYQPSRILDIGCGNRYLCKLLSEQDVECIGIEPIADGIAYAQKLAPTAKFYPPAPTWNRSRRCRTTSTPKTSPTRPT